MASAVASPASAASYRSRAASNSPRSKAASAESSVGATTSSPMCESSQASGGPADASDYPFPLAVIGTEQNPLRVAIVGSGPAGFYMADHVLKHEGTHD